MASGPHTFTICTVFSPERFKGNPLAIVAVRGNAITQERKSLIAKEFGYSETVFLHDAPGPKLPRQLDIFTGEGEEIPFAGHPTIGAAHYIFVFCERYVGAASPHTPQAQRQSSTLLTKAGPIPIVYDPYRQVAACTVPVNFHVHEARLSLDDILSVQPQIRIVPTIDKIKSKGSPIVSVVKGMTFAYVDLSEAPEILGSLTKSEAPAMRLDAEWSPSFTGVLYYNKQDTITQPDEPTIHAIQARMITQGMEDPGTGSACTGLACYLAIHESASGQPVREYTTAEDEIAGKTEDVKISGQNAGPTKPKLERHVYAIQQGVEMGRLCTIAVEVDVAVQPDGTKKIANVALSGRANFFAKGELMP